MLNFIIFSHNIFSSSDFTGYIQAVQEVQKSKSTQNLYFDIQLKTGKDETHSVRIMVQRGESSKCQVFLNKLQSQQPITLSNLQVAPSNMVFLQGYSYSRCASTFHSVSIPTTSTKDINICRYHPQEPQIWKLIHRLRLH